jgi:hypothetical protein
MGREIRRVPPNWEHPKKEYPDHRSMRMAERYQPLYNRPFAPSMREWYANWEAWERGERPDYCSAESRDLPFWEWDGGPPDPEYHRPDWKPEEMTWFQMYETVSEGTPVSPPFASKEELVDYLATNGDFWDQARVKEGRREGPAAWGREAAEQFVKSEWAPSLAVQNGVVYEARDSGLPPTVKASTP